MLWWRKSTEQIKLSTFDARRLQRSDYHTSTSELFISIATPWDRLFNPAYIYPYMKTETSYHHAQHNGCITCLTFHSRNLWAWAKGGWLPCIASLKNSVWTPESWRDRKDSSPSPTMVEARKLSSHNSLYNPLNYIIISSTANFFMSWAATRTMEGEEGGEHDK